MKAIIKEYKAYIIIVYLYLLSLPYHSQYSQKDIFHIGAASIIASKYLS